MKLGVICDGISRDLAHALAVMDEFGLDYAELQYVGDTEVGDHSKEEIAGIKALLERHDTPVSCLSRHIFAGMTTANRPGDELHTRHMDALKRVMDMAHTLGSPLVRIMTSKKEQILWGRNGAEKWNVAKGAWDTLPPLIAPAVELARAEGLTLVVETGNGTMVSHNIKMIMGLWRGIGRDDTKRSRHAEVDNQCTGVSLNHHVFAPPKHGNDAVAGHPGTDIPGYRPA